MEDQQPLRDNGDESPEAYEGGAREMKSDLEIHREARLRIKLEEGVRLNPVFRTLYYGLKRNHPHNGAVIHPLAYLIRRILFACAIVFLAHANVG